MLRNTVSPTQNKVDFARLLRKRMTPAEKRLWQELRKNKFFSLSFRRQVPIGPYIVDFLCLQKNLIIEIDGDSHYEPGAELRDQKREAYLHAQGFSVLRFGEKETYNNVDGSLQQIALHLGLPME